MAAPMQKLSEAVNDYMPHATWCGDWLIEFAGGQYSLISELQVQRRTLFK